MIGKLTYDELNEIINMLENSSNNINNVLEKYKSINELGTMKIERFCADLNKYIDYLKTSLIINKDADIALERIKELSN